MMPSFAGTESPVIAAPECERQVSDRAPPCPVPGNPRARRSRGIAAILSFIIPGLGQMYLGRVGLGLAYLLSTASCYAAAALLAMDAGRTGVTGGHGGLVAVLLVLGSAIPLASCFGAAVARPGRPSARRSCT